MQKTRKIKISRNFFWDVYNFLKVCFHEFFGLDIY